MYQIEMSVLELIVLMLVFLFLSLLVINCNGGIKKFFSEENSVECKKTLKVSDGFRFGIGLMLSSAFVFLLVFLYITVRIKIS